jgi:hypothetical protein
MSAVFFMRESNGMQNWHEGGRKQRGNFVRSERAQLNRAFSVNRISRNFGGQMRRNVVANPAQNVEVKSCWFDYCFSSLPCGRFKRSSRHIFDFLWNRRETGL